MLTGVPLALPSFFQSSANCPGAGTTTLGSMSPPRAGWQTSGADEVSVNWETIKAAERAEKASRAAAGGAAASALDGVALGQPALALAAQLQRRAERAGAPGALDGGEPGVSEIGAELFALVARARQAGVDPEFELRAAARAYRDQVLAWEQEQPEQPEPEQPETG